MSFFRRLLSKSTTTAKKTLTEKNSEVSHPFLMQPNLIKLTCSYLKPTQADVSKFLQHVAFGQQYDAEQMLKENPYLIYEKGNVTDYSGREFTNISGFQYALWAFDTHMWQMIRRYLPVEVAKEQLQELEKNGASYTLIDTRQKIEKDKNEIKAEVIREPHYNFKLIKALKKFVDYCKKYEVIMRDTNADWIWKYEVGREQCLVPVHVANWYCRTDESFDPFANFDAKMELPRELRIGLSGYDYFPLNPSYQLGVHFAVSKGLMGSNEVVSIPSALIYPCIESYYPPVVTLENNLEAMIVLYNARKEDLEKLKKELKLVEDPAFRPH